MKKKNKTEIIKFCEQHSLVIHHSFLLILFVTIILAILFTVYTDNDIIASIIVRKRLI